MLSKQSLALADQNIAFSSLNSLSKPLATLYTESHTLFTSLQHIVASEMRLPSPSAARHQAPSWDKNGHLAQAALLAPPTAETVLHIRRLVGMYLEEVVRLRENAEVDEETKARFDAVYHVFNLAMILYLPQDGRGEGLLGEELLDWVNDVDPGEIQRLNTGRTIGSQDYSTGQHAGQRNHADERTMAASIVLAICRPLHPARVPPSRLVLPALTVESPTCANRQTRWNPSSPLISLSPIPSDNAIPARKSIRPGA